MFKRRPPVPDGETVQLSLFGQPQTDDCAHVSPTAACATNADDPPTHEPQEHVTPTDQDMTVSNIGSTRDHADEQRSYVHQSSDQAPPATDDEVIAAVARRVAEIALKASQPEPTL